MDPTKTLDAQYESGPFYLKPSKCAQSLICMENRLTPTAPSLCMRNDLNGTNTPATDEGYGYKPHRLECEQDLRENFPSKYVNKQMNPEFSNVYFNLESGKTAPIFGEFSNLKPPMYVDYDPNVKTDQIGIIYVSVTYTDTPQDLRHKDARHTAYDSRNDPSWHYVHGIASFDVLRMVKTALVPFAVSSLDEFNATDDENQPITQAWFADIMDYMNGKKSFEGISARNTSKYTAKRQDRINKSNIPAGKSTDICCYNYIAEKVYQTDIINLDQKQLARDSSIALSAFNKTLMFQMEMVNRLQQAHIPVVFVEYGSGGVSSLLRSEGALFNQIPQTALEPNVAIFNPIQERFQLLADHNRNKRRYLDYLREDASLNFLTFKPRHGCKVVKRASDGHGKYPDEKIYSSDQLDRYRCFSEIVDINSNVADLVVIKNDPVFPVMDYLIPMEGSTHMISHYNHIANLIPHWHERQMFTKVS